MQLGSTSPIWNWAAVKLDPSATAGAGGGEMGSVAGPGGTPGLGGVVTATGVISASRVMYHSAEKVLLSSKPSPGLRMSRGSSGTWACSISSAKVRVAKLDKCFLTRGLCSKASC